MKSRLLNFLFVPFVCFVGLLPATAEEAKKIESKSTYEKAYGKTKGGAEIDPSKDLPRYPAVEPKDAIATWQVKKGFHLELAANEPQVRSPVAVSFDERGRMFVCEMIDYSEMRDVTPHLGRISVLEDKDGDGHYESSKVFADDLAWPTGVICANGGIFVIATPDIFFFKDTDGDGKADVREVVFTGLGTGLKLLNVQGLANCPQWGLDNRIHIQCGGGNRGKMKCLKRPDLPEVELGGRDLWFDPRTFDFGLEAGGAQFGMSFDNYGRKFACSNSDHLQFFVCDDKYAARNPYFDFPHVRQSVAVDGGAAEVFRISPDEPWRIIRTRWRIAGVVKGAVEGGGRVSGYFTGATGTTVYRGDAYGPDFLNNTFTGDAGGQLVHRKLVVPDGVSVKGMRPSDEQNFEFAASKDTWVRVVNFANAPDGCMHICDMYREVIEHPWSIPDEIKKYIDLNSGNDRGRIYRITPDNKDWKRRPSVDLSKASTEELVKTLAHENGWHRDCAARLLYERNDKAAVPLLEKMASESPSALGRLHALCALEGFDAVHEPVLLSALKDKDEHVREWAARLTETAVAGKRVSEPLQHALEGTAADPSPRVRMQTGFTLCSLVREKADPSSFPLSVISKLFFRDAAWPSAATFPPEVALPLLRAEWSRNEQLLRRGSTDFSWISPCEPLVHMIAARNQPDEIPELLEMIAKPFPKDGWVAALAQGLKRAGTTIDKVDKEKKLASVFDQAGASATTASRDERKRALSLLGFATFQQAAPAALACLAKDQPQSIQTAAVGTLGQFKNAEVSQILLDHWANFGAETRAAALTELLSRPDRTLALLKSIQDSATTNEKGSAGFQPASGGILPPSEAKRSKQDASTHGQDARAPLSIRSARPLPTDLSPAQIQSLLKSDNKAIADLAKTALASVIPPSRESVLAKFQPALATKGDMAKGQLVFLQRCIACHRAAGQGIQVGPDFVTVKTKGKEALMTAILDPHKEVAPQFIAYTINTKDGQTLAGIVTKDDASSMTIKIMGGAEINLPRSNIKGSSSSGQSLMPEGIEAGMTVQDMADLLEFIEKAN